MHVFADIQSYICTHNDCTDALKTFPSRELWADHEFGEHLTIPQWRCVKCLSFCFSKRRFVEHLREAHAMELADDRLTAVIMEFSEMKLIPTFSDYPCPLCSKNGWQTKKAYSTHVGRHLEEISLACLPRNADWSSDVGFNDNSTSRASTDASALDNPEGEEVDADAGAKSKLPARFASSSELLSAPAERKKHEDPHEAIVGMMNAVNERPQRTMTSSPSPSPLSEKLAGAESPRHTSYWSVAEQRNFRTLLAHFGEDFEGISKSLKTKSPVMVRSILPTSPSTLALFDQI
jgi:hypothetical protein